MYEVLNELNKTTGITGSMVVGNDGIVIAADLDERFEGETIGALARGRFRHWERQLQMKTEPRLTIDQTTCRFVPGHLPWPSCTVIAIASPVGP